MTIELAPSRALTCILLGLHAGALAAVLAARPDVLGAAIAALLVLASVRRTVRVHGSRRAPDAITALCLEPRGHGWATFADGARRHFEVAAVHVPDRRVLLATLHVGGRRRALVLGADAVAGDQHWQARRWFEAARPAP